MRSTASLISVALLTAGALLSWMTTLTGLPADLRAADTPAAKPPTGGSPVLPVLDAPFGGVIGRKASESTPDFPQDVTPPEGAPNVLLIMTDDTGFGAASTF